MWYVDEEDQSANLQPDLDCDENDAICTHEHAHSRDIHELIVRHTSESQLHTNNKSQSNSDFKSKVKNHNKGLSLFGTVPPPKKLPIEQVSQIAESVAESIRLMKPDGVVVYDIQDEPSRNGTTRPFPFFHTHEPRTYAKLLENLSNNTEAIIYRGLMPGESETEFVNWVKETVQEYNGKNLVLVGGCTHSGETILSVPHACELIKQNFPQLFLGGITIPERHRDRVDEHTRIQEKAETGIAFFTSQVVYNADNAIGLLRDYDEMCKTTGKSPVRIVFTFAPFGSDQTVLFLRWLGVELPEGTVRRVLSRASTGARIQESLEICLENWKRILDYSRRMNIQVPIGFSVESVSKSALELKGAVQLFSTLNEEMELYYNATRPK